MRSNQTARFPASHPHLNKLRSAAAGQTARRGTAQLELGREHPISLELRKALLSTKSITAQWSEGLEGILYGPEHLMLQTLDDILRQTGAEPAKNGKGRVKAALKRG